MNQYKTCYTCKIAKPINEFGIHRNRSDGIDSYCLECRRKARAAYRQRCKDAIKSQQAANYKNNRNARLTYAKQNAKPYDSEMAEIRKRWRNKNKALMAAYQRARTAAKKGNGRYAITRKDLQKLYAQPCIYCGSKQNIEIDHVIPIARGGTHGIGNLTSACRKCNRSRQDKLIMEWRIQQRKTP